MTYQEQYEQLIEELTDLEDKREGISHKYTTKMGQKNKMDLKDEEIEKELKELENKKETILFSKKINILSTLYSILPVVIPIAIMILSIILTSIYTNKVIEYISYNILITLPIATIGTLIPIYMGKKVISKECDKIKNSDEYIKIINNINKKQREKEILNKKQIQIVQELELTLEDLNIQKELVEIKLKEIADFKDEVFYSIVDKHVQNEEKKKPYRRIKIKGNKQGE